MASRKKAATRDLFGSVVEDAPSAADPAPKRPRKRARPAAAAKPVDPVAVAVDRLSDLVGRLEAMIAEVPRAAEFEPLAEHIYAFAQTGPKLMESLESVKDAVPQIEQATQALGETATTLQDTNQRLAESLMRLPSAEDYEPLVAPLVEFTKVSPALTQTLREAVVSFSAVSEATRRLEAISTSLKQVEGEETRPAAPRSPPASGLTPRHARVAVSLETLANEIDSALVKIPKDPEYARVAEQLRELATVSPSLMEWMKEVKPLSPPLAGSVVALRRVANALRENAALLRGEKES